MSLYDKTMSTEWKNWYFTEGKMKKVTYWKQDYEFTSVEVYF